jgi:hypothetical protein
MFRAGLFTAIDGPATDGYIFRLMLIKFLPLFALDKIYESDLSCKAS